MNSNGLDTATWTHDNGNTTLWLAASTDPDPYVIFDLGAVYTVNRFHVWNYNGADDPKRGINAVTIRYGKTSGLGSTVGGITSFDKAPGTSGYRGQAFASFTPFTAQYVKFDIESSYLGLPPTWFGASEVVFFGNRPVTGTIMIIR